MADYNSARTGQEIEGLLDLIDISLTGSAGKALTVNTTEDGLELTDVSSSTGDMEKAVYDTNSDGKVDAADTADSALIADEVTGVSGSGTYQYYGTDSNGDIGVWPIPVTEASSGLPTGGTTGQLLAKSSNVDGDADWSDLVITYVPSLKARVYLGNAASTLATGWQTVPLDSVDYDTDSIWDSVNNYLVPNQEGYYQINGRVRTETAGSVTLGISKNGTNLQAIGASTSSVNVMATGGSCIVYCNGTTDYIEMTAYFSSVRSYTALQFDTYLDISGPITGTTVYGAGDMQTTVYDTDSDGIVDVSMKSVESEIMMWHGF